MSYSESVSSSSVFSHDDGRLRTLASNADEEKGAVDPAARAGLTNRTGRAEAGTGDRGTRNGISTAYVFDRLSNILCLVPTAFSEVLLKNMRRDEPTPARLAEPTAAQCRFIGRLGAN